MALRSLNGHYTLPAEALDNIDYEESARKLREFMKDFRSHDVRKDPELAKQVGIHIGEDDQWKFV